MQHKQIVLYKTAVFITLLMPVAYYCWGVYARLLGPNAVEALLHGTGIWALRLLLLTLAMPMLAKLFTASWILRARRIVGLYGFFYAFLHVGVYLAIDRYFHWDEIVKDIVKRPYITLGLFAFVAMIPLAATSTNSMMRRLGERWKSLHRSSYLIASLAILHYLLSLKADLRAPVIYAMILAALVASRAHAMRAAASTRRSSASA